jgi:hypothetical protein
MNLDAYWLAKQNNLSAIVYHDLMMDNINEVTDVRLKALKEIERKTRLELPRHITRKSNLPSGRISV